MDKDDYKFTMKILITIALWFLCIGSLYAISVIRLGIGYTIGSIDNAESINHVLENLSYSYLAGCIFYIFTSTLPVYYKKRKLSPTIQSKLKLIHGKLEDCKKQAFTLQEYNSVHSDEEFISRVSSTSINNPCALALVYNGMTIANVWRKQKEDVLIVIADLLRYQDGMSEDQIIAIAALTNSQFFDLLKAINMPLLDTPDTRKKIARALVTEIHRMNRII